MSPLVVRRRPEDGQLHQNGYKLKLCVHVYWWYRLASLCYAMNVVALITEKLQKQSLDEPSASTSSSAQVPVTDSTIQQTTLSPTTNTTLSIKGKNVWTLSIDTSSHGTNKQDGGRKTFRGLKGSKATNHNTVCDMSPGTPNAPPPKKHCRSLSVPPDQSGSTWQPILHKPIPVMYTDFNLHSTKFCAQGQITDVSGTRSHFAQSFFNSASPVSLDSGHVTASDFQTPPGSPVPRPASAMSDISHSSFWFDHSPFKFNRFEILQNRSLSCEDRISSRPLCGSANFCVDSLRHSSPPRINRIPRCKSQPCVLHDRKCGKKRRHDYDRPMLDFTKMTQTAYNQSTSMTKPIPFLPSNIMRRPHRDLVPIASSPLDTDIPFYGLDAFPTSPIDSTSDTCTSVPSQQHQEPDSEFMLDSGLDGCDCHDNRSTLDHEILFPLKDLDVDEIEKH